MRILIAVCIAGAALLGCKDDEDMAQPTPAPIQAGPEVVVYEAGPMLTQCTAPAITLPQSAAKLTQAGIAVRVSSCGVMEGVAFPTVCGAGTGQILLHNIPEGRQTQAEALGFRAADSLVDDARRTGWRRTHCGGHQPFLDFARNSANCAQTKNRVLLINSRTRLDRELVLVDQAGTCADAAYRQLLLGDTVDEVLCSHEQTIAGPFKRCTATAYAALFDTVIANLNTADLGLGPDYAVWELLL